MSSFFGKMFGAPKETAPPPAQVSQSTVVALQNINQAIEMLQKKNANVEKKMMMELLEAKKCGTANKSKALFHLKKKKRYEDQIRVIHGQIDNLSAQADALEMLTVNRETLSVLSGAHQAIKRETQGLNADKVGDIMDEMQEQLADLKEITNALSTNTIGEQYDEDELLAELEGLEQEELDAQLLSVEKPDALAELPQVPTHNLPQPVAATEDEDELREMAAWS